jgi:hypothetical protein
VSRPQGALHRAAAAGSSPRSRCGARLQYEKRLPDRVLHAVVARREGPQRAQRGAVVAAAIRAAASCAAAAAAAARTAPPLVSQLAEVEVEGALALAALAALQRLQEAAAAVDKRRRRAAVAVVAAHLVRARQQLGRGRGRDVVLHGFVSPMPCQ